MFLSAAVRRRPTFREGVVNMAPMAVGIGAWGLMTGVAMVKSGMSVIEALRQAEVGALQPVAQPTHGVTYAHKIEKHEAAVDWQQDAATIVRRIRAFDPFPGASSTLDGAAIKFWAARARAATVADAPGTVLAVSPAGIEVAAHDSIVSFTELQRPGGKRLPVADFLHGFDVKAGQVFG